MAIAKEAAFFVGFRGEKASEDIVRFLVLHEIHRNGGELGRFGRQLGTASSKDVASAESELKTAMDALRQSEEQAERLRRSSELREKEQARNVERLQKMIGRQAELDGNGWFNGSGEPELEEAEPIRRRETEPARRRETEPARRQEAEPVLRRERVQDAPPQRRNTVMDDLVEMAASDDEIVKEELFSIDECLENVMVLQRPVCAKKNIRLELKKSVSMPESAIGDKAKLQRALVSLLESVTQQMPSGGVINLGCRADRASGNRVFLYFIIRDNESSIASDLMQGMFENKSEKDDPLRAGLYIAREIIGIMGGNVRVRSRRGEGTEFTVTVCMKLPGRA